MKRTVLATAISLCSIYMAQGGQETLQPARSSQEEILELEQERNEALSANDASTLDRLYADDYTATSPQGRASVKADVIHYIRTHKLQRSFVDDEVRVRVYGDTALVTGRTTLVEKEPSGQTIRTQQRFLRVWLKRAGRWKLVAHQSTPIV